MWSETFVRTGALVWLSVIFVVGGAGCGSSPKSTRMTVEDYQEVGADIAAHLQEELAVGLLADRSPDSPEWVIAVQKVVNYTDDLMSEGAKWYLMQSVKDSLPKPFLKSKNIQFVIPAEHLREAKRKGEIPEDAYADRKPTHVLTGTFRSASRAIKKERTDAYMLDSEIREMASGEVVWSGQVTFKRWAEGKKWD